MALSAAVASLTNQSTSSGVIPIEPGFTDTPSAVAKVYYILTCTTGEGSGTDTVHVEVSFDGILGAVSVDSESILLATTGNRAAGVIPIDKSNPADIITWQAVVTGTPADARYAAHVWLE